MGKRFIDTEINRTSMRGVDVKLRFAFEWLWANCDHAGVWRMDLDLFKFEAGYKLDVQALTKTCPRVQTLPNGNLFMVDFIAVNYGELKPGYNPHKPVFRSLEANGIDPTTSQFQDLPNPSQRVEEEGEGEDTQGSGKERARKGPDPDVQTVVDYLTERLRSENIAQSIDGSAENNRWAARSLILKLRKDYPDHDALVSARALIDAALADPFHRKNTTTVRYLLNNCGKIIAATKERKSNPKTQTDADRKQELADALERRRVEREQAAADRAAASAAMPQG